MRLFSLACLVAVYAFTVFAVPTASTPTVRLDTAIFTGVTSGNVSRFLGIPFALPPIGDRRFRLPSPIPPYTTSFSATNFGPSCPQQAIGSPQIDKLAEEARNFIIQTFSSLTSPEDEDCLTINIIAPASATPNSKLPVVAWIYGGGFEIGVATGPDGGIIVDRSIEMGTPVIFVSMNYRLSGLGFLASREVKEAGVGNLGLQDQRQALRWVQKYIHAFGGDPKKVTIWGESAGAISVALQMITNNGNTEGLFRGGFMQSGASVSVGDITNGQQYYDAIVSQTGCTGASDTLDCLRGVPYKEIMSAINTTPGFFSYQSLVLSWLPRADGVFLTDNPQRLVQQGKIANIPFVTGNCDDEGTLFSLNNLNVTTETDFRNYLGNTIFPGISSSQLDRLVELYPSDPSAGSPYDTGILNAITPQFKRIASILGDMMFQAPRRFFLQHTSQKQNTWAFLSKRMKDLPDLGSVHSSDLQYIYGGGDLLDYLIRFVVKLDPNGGQNTRDWPKYTNNNPRFLTLTDGSLTITRDDYRKEAMAFLMNVTFAHPI